MAAFSENNITLLTVGSAATKTTGGIATLNDGEIGVFTPTGVRYTEATAVAGAPFMLVQGRGTATPIMGKVIKSANVKTVIKKLTVAATEQVDYIGYNGAGGSINAINGNLYIVRINIDQSLTSNHGGQYIKHGQYKADGSGTQVEIATGLADSILKNFLRETEKLIKVERLTNSVVTATTTGTLAVVNGNQYVTASMDIDAGGAVVGDYLSINGSAYKIIELNVGGAQIAKLDVPYQGGTNAAIADASVGLITIASADAGNWGIKITGLPLNFVVGKKSYRKAKWNLTLQDFGTTTLTNSVGATPGTGTAEQSAELEFFLRGNTGEYLRMGEPNIFPRITDVEATTYTTLQFLTEEEAGLVTKNGRNINFLTMLPSDTPDYALTATADDITDVLEILLAGVPTYGGSVSTDGGALVAGDLALV